MAARMHLRTLLTTPTPCPSPSAIAEACRLARTLLCYVPPGEPRPARAIQVAEAWLCAGAPASQYPAVERARLSAANCAAEAAARASRALLGSSELLTEELHTAAALAARRACAGDVAGVQECLRTCATLTATAGVYS
jgi:hypothetical protein